MKWKFWKRDPDSELWEDAESRIVRKYGYPPHLAKACFDPFDYAIGLTTGDVWYFREATPVSREWVVLTEMFPVGECEGDNDRPPFERGVCVRIDQIVWVADAPHGS